MKVKIIRESGRPVKLEQLEKFDEDFKAAYDAIAEECGQDMEAMHNKLDGLDAKLAEKYDTIVEIEYPKSALQFRKLLKQYGLITMGLHASTDELVMIIKDMEF